MTILGILIILSAIAMYIVTKSMNLRKESQSVDNGYGGKTHLPAHPKLLTEWTAGKSIKLGAIGLAFTMITGMFFYNPAGTATSVQYLWGGDEAVTSQGLKLKLWGRTIPVSFEIALQDVIEEVEQEEGIYYRHGQL
jgi:multisubunit Na+/H+ antiporter MnhB subunit